ncbi:MAG: DUF1016 N-terminal domain-containing protein [Candidatus Accumulibacter sp.]|jgi:hypothetical protein|nr:DUF1016 N-terminal domain-containing protein [Accumulibacter sp.]
MNKEKGRLVSRETTSAEEAALFERVSTIIENRKSRAGACANREITLMYWEIGRFVEAFLLDGERAEYGKRIVASLAQQLKRRYGSSFDYTNIRRMIQFSRRFPDIEIVAPLAQQLSWSHFIELLPLKSDEALMYYADDSAGRRLTTKQLRHQIRYRLG